MILIPSSTVWLHFFLIVGHVLEWIYARRCCHLVFPERFNCEKIRGGDDFGMFLESTVLLFSVSTKGIKIQLLIKIRSTIKAFPIEVSKTFLKTCVDSLGQGIIKSRKHVKQCKYNIYANFEGNSLESAWSLGWCHISYSRTSNFTNRNGLIYRNHPPTLPKFNMEKMVRDSFWNHHFKVPC